MAVILNVPKEASFENDTLTIPDGVSIKEPILYSATGDTPFTIEVGAGADVTFIETLASDKSVNLGMLMRLQARSTVKLISVAVNNNINIQRNVLLTGESASYAEQDVFYCKEQQGFGISTAVVNDAPKTKAHVAMHGVLDNSAKASCTGTMRVNKGAKQSDSKLAQHVLLLSKESKAENFPYLEIEESDVTAGHAATVRPLDEEQLFYLCTRGLTRKEAKKTLVNAFLTPFVMGLDAHTQKKIFSLIEDNVIAN